MTAPINNQPVTNHEIWLSAMKCINSNRYLALKTASPYYRCLAVDCDDLLKEATIAAFAARKEQVLLFLAVPSDQL